VLLLPRITVFVSLYGRSKPMAITRKGRASLYYTNSNPAFIVIIFVIQSDFILILYTTYTSMDVDISIFKACAVNNPSINAIIPLRITAEAIT
jgi:hypothetical protein